MMEICCALKSLDSHTRLIYYWMWMVFVCARLRVYVIRVCVWKSAFISLRLKCAHEQSDRQWLDPFHSNSGSSSSRRSHNSKSNSQLQMNDIIGDTAGAVCKSHSSLSFVRESAAHTNLNQMYEIYKCILVVISIHSLSIPVHTIDV